ncbi:MAG TPA: archease [Nitrospirota bacterium]|nr:archease [Nitrospirota bacterium]
MPYRYLDDVAIADVAFEAEGKTLRELFESSALALTNIMISKVETLEPKVIRCFEVTAENPEMLLYHFLQELVFYKDAERLLFGKFELAVEQEVPAWRLRVAAVGEELSYEKHELLADAKAVSFHNFSVRKTADGWRADVIVDV